MLDCKGKELEEGQRVVFSVGTTLKTGTVQKVRIRHSYGNEYPIANVFLDEPIRRYEKGTYERGEDGFYRHINGDEKTPQTVRYVDSSDRILILDNSTE